MHTPTQAETWSGAHRTHSTIHRYAEQALGTRICTDPHAVAALAPIRALSCPHGLGRMAQSLLVYGFVVWEWCCCAVEGPRFTRNMLRPSLVTGTRHGGERAHDA
jgi:hypothetical protein